MSAIVRTQVVDGWTLAYTDEDEEPTVRDADLARELGFTRPRNIRQLAERWKRELGEFRCTVQRNPKKSDKGGRPEIEYLFTEEQALFLAAKSDTPRATEILKVLVRVFVSARKGQLPAPSRVEAAADVILRAATNPERFRGGAELRDNNRLAGKCKGLIGNLAVLRRVSWAKAHGLLRKAFGVVSYLRIPVDNWQIVADWFTEEMSVPVPVRLLPMNLRQIEMFERSKGEPDGEPH